MKARSASSSKLFHYSELIKLYLIIAEILNSNNYDPMPKAGQHGMPVYIGSHEEAKMKTLYQINRFNLLASDRISVKRSLPDPRKKKYDTWEMIFSKS